MLREDCLITADSLRRKIHGGEALRGNMKSLCVAIVLLCAATVVAARLPNKERSGRSRAN
jgi:hypothetical protein